MKNILKNIPLSMKFKITAICVVFFSSLSLFAQSFAPAAGQIGTTAMHKDSSAFIAWASGAELKRGYLNYSDTNFTIDGSNKVSHGEIADVIGSTGETNMNVVSLGDGGSVTLTFERPISNENGPDFAVFENSFQDDFLELAFVEVSSDGEHFFRFPAVSEIQTQTQVGSFGLTDCRYIHNLAGKYRINFGTPFDLDELSDDLLLDKMHITHVRIIDVIGSINPLFASYDVNNNPINDPFPTPFASGGFDLDAVGVIHQAPLSVPEMSLISRVFPNPATESLNIQLKQRGNIRILDLTGKAKLNFQDCIALQINVQSLDNGVYFIEIESDGVREVKRFLKK